MIIFFLIFSNRPASPNPQRKQQAPLNPPTNTFLARDAPPPPFRPNPMPNTLGGNPTALPTPMMPQYVITIYRVFFINLFQKRKLNDIFISHNLKFITLISAIYKSQSDLFLQNRIKKELVNKIMSMTILYANISNNNRSNQA